MDNSISFLFNSPTSSPHATVFGVTATDRKNAVSILSRFTTNTVAAATTVALVVVMFLWVFGGQATAGGGSGSLEVNGIQYEFTPTECTVTETDFVTAGTGSVDGESFWISASGRSVSLTVGTDAEGQRPSNDQVWMTSVGGLDWIVEGDSLQIDTIMEDGRIEPSPRYQANLEVTCTSSA